MCKESKDLNGKAALRICCYGSSSQKSKQVYIDAAYLLGRTLGERGHTTVNGAGAHGCMGAMNEGVMHSNGKVVGVRPNPRLFMKGGSRSKWNESCHLVFKEGRRNSELKIVGGEDLHERKKMLVKDADGLIVLPGGPGTFDELWEMVCALQIGLIDIPIVCVNVDGYYEPFRLMLDRAYKDNLLYKDPASLLHFEASSEEAVNYVERIASKKITSKESGPVENTNGNRMRLINGLVQNLFFILVGIMIGKLHGN